MTMNDESFPRVALLALPLTANADLGSPLDLNAPRRAGVGVVGQVNAVAVSQLGAAAAHVVLAVFHVGCRVHHGVTR